MVSKKVTKRKTVWRSLPISVEPEVPTNGSAPKTHRHRGISTAETVQASSHQTVGVLGAGDDVLRPAASCAGTDVTGTGNHQGATTTTTTTNHASSLVSSSSTAATSYHQGHQQRQSAAQYEDFNGHISAGIGRTKHYSAIHRRFSNHNDNGKPTSTLSRRQSSSSNSHADIPSTKSISSSTTAENSSNNNVSNETTPQTYSSANVDNNNSRSLSHYNRRSDRYGSYRPNGAYSGSSYRRRPFSSNHRYYGGNTRSTFRIHRTAEAEGTENDNVDQDKENETKTLFNEDDYTRITTPRQDVLFKKGYLSRPKPYVPPTTEPMDNSTTDDVAMITIEEAIAAGLVHGYDPENPFLGYYDAHGVFYVNPYISNAVDPYSGQIILTPVESDPYITGNIPECYVEDALSFQTVENSAETIVENPVENPLEKPLDNPVENIDEENELNQPDTSVSTSIDPTETDVAIKEPFCQEIDDIGSNDDSLSGSTTKGNEGDGEETSPEATIYGSATEYSASTTPGFVPQYLYPFIYGAPAFLPSNGVADQSFGNSHENYGKFNRFKKRKRKPFKYPNSTEPSATTTDYSEDDDYVDHSRILHSQQLAFIPAHMLQYDNECSMEAQTNTEVSAFYSNEYENHILPTTPPPSPSPSTLAATTLNVNVAEFRPRNPVALPRTMVTNQHEHTHDSEDSGVSTSEVVHSSDSSPETPDPTSTPKQSTLVPSQIMDPSDPPLVPFPKRKSTHKNSAYHTSRNISDIRSDPSSGLISPSDKHSTEVSGSLSYAAMAQRQTTAIIVKSDLAAKDDIVMPPKQQTGNNNLVSVKKPQSSASNGRGRRSSANTNANPNNTNGKHITTSKKHTNQKSSPAKKQAKTQSPDPIDNNSTVQLVEPEITIKTEPKVDKPALPSFAQLLRPTAPIAPVSIKPVAVKLSEQPENCAPSVAKTVDKPTDVIEIAHLKAAIVASSSTPTYHTIKVNGKKRTVLQEEPADFWDEKVEEKIVKAVVELVEPKSKPIETVKELDQEENVPLVTRRPKTKKPKSKKAPTKSERIINCESKESTETPLEEFLLSTPVSQVDEDLSEIEEYNFVTDPEAIFANAIAPVNIFASPRSDKSLLSQSGSAGFGGLFASPNFGVKSSLNDTMLRQEEDMVMRIMRSLSSVEPKSPIDENEKKEMNSETLLEKLEPITVSFLDEENEVKIFVDEASNNSERISESVLNNEFDVGNVIIQSTLEIASEITKNVDTLLTNAINLKLNSNEARNKCMDNSISNGINSIDTLNTISETKCQNKVETHLEVVKNGKLNSELDDKVNVINGKSDQEHITNGNQEQNINGKSDQEHITNGKQEQNINGKSDQEHITNGKQEKNLNGKSDQEHITNGNLEHKMNGSKNHMENGHAKLNGHTVQQPITPNGKHDFLSSTVQSITGKKDCSQIDEVVCNNVNGTNDANGTIADSIDSFSNQTNQLQKGCDDKVHQVKNENGIEKLLTIDTLQLSNEKLNENVKLSQEEIIIEDDRIPTETEETTSNLDSNDTSDGCSDLSSMDTDDDERTVVGPLDEYIEDVMVDERDSLHLLNSGEFYEGDDLIVDPMHDGDLDEIIKQAEQIVRLSSDVESWAKASKSSVSYKDPDRNESPRSSEDSGILENHEEPITSPTESESGQSDQYLKFPLTEAVAKWLEEKQKEKSPEPIIRIPEHPILSGQIEKSIQRFQISEMLKSYADDEEEEIDDYGVDDMTTDESEDDVLISPKEPSKNLQSNPLPVLSADCTNADNIETDKRVAEPQSTSNKTTSTKPSPAMTRIAAQDDPDILEYWENDPMLQAPKSKGGRSIDYAKLLAKVSTKTTIQFMLSGSSSQQSEHMTAASSNPHGPPLPLTTKVQKSESGCVVM